MFGKLEATQHINTSGVGLGLSICKKIVEALEGSIYIEEDAERSDISGYIKTNEEEGGIESISENFNDISPKVNVTNSE